MVQGATIPQLKSICGALEECEGFNGEGWVKSRVSSKKRATIDLYLKQMPNIVATEMEEGEGLEDEAAGVLLSHMTDFIHMEEELKMYPASVGVVNGCGITLVFYLNLDLILCQIYLRYRCGCGYSIAGRL